MPPDVSVSIENLNKNIKELEDKSDNQRKVYLEKLIEFFKWTTTITIAALLWIGTNYNSISNLLFLNISIVSFGLSIISAFIFIIVILGWINYELKLNTDYLESLKRKASGQEPIHPIGVEGHTENIIISWLRYQYRDFCGIPSDPPVQYDIINELMNKYKKISKILIGGTILTILHGVFLLGGILFFILAIAIVPK